MNDRPTGPNVVIQRNNLSWWRKVQALSVAKLVTVLLGFGIGIGAGTGAMSWILNWYNQRPVAAKVWSKLTLPIGMTAKLKTDWNGRVRYQFRIEPETENLKSAFETAVRSSGLSSREFSIHFYDKAGFEVCSTDFIATPSAGPRDQIVALIANGSFYCSRADYNTFDSWHIGYRFPKLSAVSPADTKGEPKPTAKSADPSDR